MVDIYIYIYIYGGHIYIYVCMFMVDIYIYMVDIYTYIYMVDINIYIYMVDTHTYIYIWWTYIYIYGGHTHTYIYIYIYVHHKSVCQPSGTSSSGFQRNISYIHLVHRVPTACDKPHTNAYTSTILRVVFSIPSIFKITIQYNSDKRCKQNII